MSPIVGASALRALFWRRRNERLAARLSSVVETCERVRKSFTPPPPRVVIDTSFLEASAQAQNASEPSPAELPAGTDAGLEQDHASEAQPGVATEQRELDARLEGEVLREQAPPAGDEAAWSAAEVQREIATLHEAVEQTELVARREIEAQRERIERLEAETQREQAARREAEADRER